MTSNKTSKNRADNPAAITAENVVASELDGWWFKVCPTRNEADKISFVIGSADTEADRYQMVWQPTTYPNVVAVRPPYRFADSLYIYVEPIDPEPDPSRPEANLHPNAVVVVYYNNTVMSDDFHYDGAHDITFEKGSGTVLQWRYVCSQQPLTASCGGHHDGESATGSWWTTRAEAEADAARHSATCHAYMDLSGFIRTNGVVQCD